MTAIGEPRCARCGDALVSRRTGRCAACAARPPVALSLMRAVGHYDGTLRTIIHAFKYGRRRSLGGPLAALVRVRCPDALIGADACVPVPLHWKRRWTRGFNQAEELANGLGLPVLLALRRTRLARPQATLPARQRAANVRGAFALRRWPRLRHGGVRRGHPIASLAGLTVVLVDDVMTTGATLEACAEALRAAGVQEVRAVTVARVAARSVR